MAQFEDLLSDRLAQRIQPLRQPLAQQIWTERTRLLDALNRLPQTVCHRDAFRGNLFTRQDEQGRERGLEAAGALLAALGAAAPKLPPLDMYRQLVRRTQNRQKRQRM